MGALINSKINFNGINIPNRVVLQPMEGCDCNNDGTPSELTREKYVRAARSGAGLIWVEACAVCPEGRTSERQMMLSNENCHIFKDFISELRGIARKECGIEPMFILQLTHSGRQSITPMISYRHLIYEEKRPVSDENIVSDEYLDTLPQKYADAARNAVLSGFDGVDVKCCHGYLFQEMLSSFSRKGKYGGSFENRSRLYLDCVHAVKAAVPEGYSVVTRFGVADMIPYPYGFGTTAENEIDFTEPDMLIEKLIDAGISMLNVTIGNPYYNPHINRPYRIGAYEAPEAPEVGLERFRIVEKHIKDKFPSLILVGSGLSYYRGDLMKMAEKLLEDGICDLVGFGRMWLAYSDFYRDYIKGVFSEKKCCISCSKCTALMRAKCVSGCAVFIDYYKKLYDEKVR